MSKSLVASERLHIFPDYFLDPRMVYSCRVGWMRRVGFLRKVNKPRPLSGMRRACIPFGDIFLHAGGAESVGILSIETHSCTTGVGPRNDEPTPSARVGKLEFASHELNGDEAYALERRDEAEPPLLP